MSVDSIKNTIIVALGVCFVSSILVSASVVTLKPRQVANMELDKLKNILIIKTMILAYTFLMRNYL